MSLPPDDELDKFATTAPREIAYNLQRLIYGGDRVTVSFNEDNDNLLTVLIDLDES